MTADLPGFLLVHIAEDESDARYTPCDCLMEGFPLVHGRDGYVASACDEHAAELLAFPGVRVSSDAPPLVGDEHFDNNGGGE